MGWRTWDRTTKVIMPSCVILVLVCALLGYALITGWPNDRPSTDPTPPVSPPPSDSQSPSASATPTPTPTPTPTAPGHEEQERAAIKQAVLDFKAVRNKVRMDPDADVDLLKKVAGGVQLTVELDALKEWRAKGWRLTKGVTVENLSVTRVGETNGERTATASYCVNSTDVDVLDRHGDSVVRPGRPDHFPKMATLVMTGSGGWILVDEKDGGDACDT